MTAPQVSPAATPALTDADAMISQDDAAFALEFGLAAPPAGDPAPEPSTETDPDPVVEYEDAPAPVSDEPAEPAVEPETPPPAASTETPESKPPATVFKVYDKDGELEVPPDFEVEFPANKGMRKMPLDKVVRLAQSGYYNEVLQEEVKAAREMLPQAQETIGQYEVALAKARAEVAKMLEDDDYLLEQRQAYLDAQTPEAQLKRLKQEREDAAAFAAKQEQDAKIVTFANALEPKLNGLLTQYPSVGVERLWGRFDLATAKLKRGGVIPPERWPEVEQILDSDIGPWMAQLHEDAGETARTEKVDADLAVRKAREEAATTKRTFTRALKPSGTPTPVGGTQTKPRPIVSIDDATDAILGDIRKQMM